MWEASSGLRFFATRGIFDPPFNPT